MIYSWTYMENPSTSLSEFQVRLKLTIQPTQSTQSISWTNLKLLKKRKSNDFVKKSLSKLIYYELTKTSLKVKEQRKKDNSVKWMHLNYNGLFPILLFCLNPGNPKPNLSLYSSYYAKSCNEFMAPHSAS